MSQSGWAACSMDEKAKRAANEREWDLDELARAIVGCAYTVSNSLGCGFLEKVYERALAFEVASRGMNVETQVVFPIFYRGCNIGNYSADLLVERRVLVELKCVDSFCNEHIAQCINYLKASNLQLGLLFNFQKPKVEWKRIVRDK